MRKALRFGLLLAMLLGAFVFPMIPTSTVKAVREYESYIVVVLKSVEFDDDRDPFYGELELANVVTAEGLKEPQTTIWPRKDQGSSWHEVDKDEGDPRDIITIDMPIFSKKESEVGDEMAIVITAVDNDEKPGWLDTFMDLVFQLGGEVAKKLEAPDWVSQAIPIAKQVYGMLDKMFPDAEKYGIYTRILHRSEWGSGYLHVFERAADIEVEPLGLARSDLWVEYEVRRIQVPIRTPPLAVKLKSITAQNWAGPISDVEGENGEVFVKTRAFNDVAIKGPLVQMSEWGTTETGGPIDLEPGETWSPPTIGDYNTPSNVIYETDAVGAFLYVEISAWDKEPFGIEVDTNDMIAMYCRTFWPDENWGIGLTIHQNISSSNLGRWAENYPDQFVEIELEIYSHLWFSDVEVNIPSPEWEVNVEETAPYAVEVENWGNIIDYYEVKVEGIDPTWYSWGAGFDPSAVALDPGESAWGTLLITPPRHWSTSPGSHEFMVTATSYQVLPSWVKHGSDNCSSTVKVRQFFDVEVVMPSDAKTVKAGNEAIYTVGVRNLGNTQASYGLSLDSSGFEVEWATLWPDTLWDLEPGGIANALLQISVPQDWAEELTYTFTVTATEISGKKSNSATGEFNTIPLEPGEAGIEIKLTQGLDYLFMENIKIRIAVLVTDAVTHQPITGMTVTMNMYNPDGTLWASATMTEMSGTGIYEWQSSKTILDMMKKGGPSLVKGVYLVHVTTSYNGHIAQDVMELHIDPPAEGTIDLYILVIVAALAALTILALRKRQTLIRRFKTTWEPVHALKNWK